MSSGSVECGSFAWWFDGAFGATIAVKVTLVLGAAGIEFLNPAEPFVVGADGDLVPHLAEAEVLSVGATKMGIQRLRVVSAGQVVIDVLGPEGPRIRSAPSEALLQCLDADPLQIPTDFDFAYFQAAPAEQRFAGRFLGDETLVIDDASGSRSVVLPSVRVGARLFSPDRSGASLALACERLWLDHERGRVSLVFRACVGLPSTGNLVIAVDVALGDKVVHSPQLDATSAFGQTGANRLGALQSSTLPFQQNNKTQSRIARARAALAAGSGFGTPWAKPEPLAKEPAVAAAPAAVPPFGSPVSPWAQHAGASPAIGTPYAPVAVRAPQSIERGLGARVGTVILHAGAGSEFLLALFGQKHPQPNPSLVTPVSLQVPALRTL